MLKNKIISIISTVAILFSFATIAQAEKTPLITDPTFFIEDLGSEMFGTQAYGVGISYEEFETTNPWNFVKGGTTWVPTYMGKGLAMGNIKLENMDMSKAVAGIAMPEYTVTPEANGLLNYNVSSNALLVPDVTLSQKGAILFVVLTSEAVDISNVTCSNVTLYIKDLGDTATSQPTVVQEWVYSSDPEMVSLGNADFLAYTAPQSQEPEAAVTGITIDPTTATVTGGESKDFTATVTGTGDFDATYKLTASAGTITDNKTFTAPAATEVEQTITITATANGNSEVKATATVTVPAKVVVPDPEFKVTATKILKDDGETPDNYYTEDKTVQRFNCLATDYNLAGNSWLFTFSSGETHKPFTVDMTTAISGGAAAAFEAWIIGAPDDVTLSITDAE